MKSLNKRKLFVTATLLLAGLTASAQYDQEAATGIVVPAVSNKSSVSNGIVGEVIYDVANDNFYGLDKNGNWRSMSGAAQNYSEVIADSGNGHGSTGTKIRRFTNSSTTGTAVTYADSATNGATFTINETGIYSVTYFDTTSASGYLGISRNASSLTNDVQNLALAEKVGVVYNFGTNVIQTVAVTLKLNAGDVIRAQTEGTANATGTSCVFRIAKISG